MAPSDGRRPPLAVIASLRNTVRIVAANEAALRLKLATGMALADARARYPELTTADADPGADRVLLRQLAEFCERYTPLVSFEPPDLLMLDISGCCHLFGGEAGLLEDLQGRLRRAGFTLHAAIAATPGCAIALVRSGKSGIIATSDEKQQLAPLPVAALRLAEETVALLDTFGLRRIGDLYERPRAPLTARFGASLLTRLDQALGHFEEPVSPLIPVPPYIAEQRFSEPVGREEDVLGTIEQLAVQLARLMEKNRQGGRSFICDLFRVDGAIQRLTISTGRPLRDARAIRRLFAERLALVQNFDPGFGFDLIRLSAGNSDSLPDRQESLDDAAGRQPDIAGMIDRFSLRLGREGVLALHPQDRHPPEYATIAVPAAEAKAFCAEVETGSAGQNAVNKRNRSEMYCHGNTPRSNELATPLPPQDSLSPLRPIRLFARPEPIDALAEVPDGPPLRFRWRRLVHDVTASEGPERIAPEWWRATGLTPHSRDYFRIETREGARLWLYRDGFYGRETSAPYWFVHGLFA